MTHDHFIHTLLRFGETMLACGAEVHRVEDTLERMGTAYGAVRMNVLAVTTSIIVTMEMPGDVDITHMRRVIGPSGNDFAKLDECNSLSREFCASKIDADELRERVIAIDSMRPNGRSLIAGSVIASAGFAVFFGGSLLDGAAAGACGAAAHWLSSTFKRIAPNQVIYTLICSFTVGLIVCAASYSIPILHEDKIMIGVIMLLVPGAVMTNSIRDLLTGDTVFGLMRFVESMLWALALACGFMLAIALSGMAP